MFVCVDKWGVMEFICIFSVFNLVWFLLYLFNEILNVIMFFICIEVEWFELIRFNNNLMYFCFK